jgi:hypothetical protein
MKKSDICGVAFYEAKLQKTQAVQRRAARKVPSEPVKSIKCEVLLSCNFCHQSENDSNS